MIISKKISYYNYNIKSIIIKNIDIDNFEYIIINIGFNDIFIIYKEELIIKNKSFNPLKIDFNEYFDLNNFNNIFPSNKLVYYKILVSISLKDFVNFEIEEEKYYEYKNIIELFSLVNIPLTFNYRKEYLLNKKSTRITLNIKNINNFYLIMEKNNILNKLFVKPFSLFEIEKIKDCYYYIKIYDKPIEITLTGLFEEGKIIILYPKNLNYEISNGTGKLIKDNINIIQNLENFPLLNIEKKTIFKENIVKENIVKEKNIKNNMYLTSKYL